MEDIFLPKNLPLFVHESERKMLMPNLEKRLVRIRRRHNAVRKLKDCPKFKVGDRVRIIKRIKTKDRFMYQKNYVELLRDSFENKTIHTVSEIDKYGFIHLKGCQYIFLEEDLKKKEVRS